jgi:hypothetical protein
MESLDADKLLNFIQLAELSVIAGIILFNLWTYHCLYVWSTAGLFFMYAYRVFLVEWMNTIGLPGVSDFFDKPASRGVEYGIGIVMMLVDFWLIKQKAKKLHLQSESVEIFKEVVVGQDEARLHLSEEETDQLELDDLLQGETSDGSELSK